MARRDRGITDVRPGEQAGGGGLALDTAHVLPPTGPHDGDALDPEVAGAAALVDFGSIRVPVPPEGTVTVEPTAGGRMQAVHIALPQGRLSVSALAAPKTTKLWPELAGEIDTSLRESGARVRSYPGDWGRELHATSGGATSVFIGVDGARWMLYGVATGPTADAAPLDAELRRMLRGTVVMRGKQPYPVRTILPLTVPDHIEAEAAEAAPAAPAAKKRSSAKPGAGKSAPGKTAPANPDAATAAAKKAARRAAARKAAAAAAVKAAAEALAEQVAEDRAAAAAQEPDTSRSHTSRTGPHAVPGTIPTGPGPDAPLREQAPSARRAAASAWRRRPAAAGWEAPPPTEALPVAAPVEELPATDEIPVVPAAGADLPPTEALRRVEPGAGGRRRLREAGPVADLPPGGRRHLEEPPVEDPYPGGRRRRLDPDEPLGAPASTGPHEAGEPRRRYEPPADPAEPAPGRWQPEPAAGGPAWETGPDPLDAPGARRAHDPHGAPGAVAADSGVSSTGRRRLRESWDGAEPVVPVADSGVSASGRRRLRESWEGPGPAAAAPWPDEPTALDSGVSSTGRRRLRESWDGAEPVAPVPDSGVSASGRRRLREPWEQAAPAAPDGAGVRRQDELPVPAGGDPWDAGPGPGVSATGRRRLREPWEDTAEPANGIAPDTGVSSTGRRHLAQPWADAGPRQPALDPGVSSTGRRRLRESWEDTGHGATDLDAGGSASGRRRLRDPGDEIRPAGGPPPWEARPDVPTGYGPAGRARPDPGADLLSGTGGRRRLGEPERAEHRPSALDDPAGRRDGGRHAGAGEGSPPTVRLEDLLAELDPNRPRRRHRR